MLLTTILNQARGGELKSLSTVDKTDKIVIEYINAGLRALFTRFSVKTEEAIIALSDSKSLYTLDPSDTDVTVQGAPILVDDVLGIISAFDELGASLPINDTSRLDGIFTPSYNTVQVPITADGGFISIIYRQNPTILSAEDLTDANGALITDTFNVDIPPQLIEPLLHYIGYRAHGSVDGMIEKENNTHYIRFKSACTEIEDLGVMTYENLPSRDVSVKGFL